VNTKGSIDRFQQGSEPTRPSRSKELVVKALLTAKLMCFR
jgi:hypothetical protein